MSQEARQCGRPEQHSSAERAGAQDRVDPCPELSSLRLVPEIRAGPFSGRFQPDDRLRAWLVSLAAAPHRRPGLKSWGGHDVAGTALPALLRVTIEACVAEIQAGGFKLHLPEQQRGVFLDALKEAGFTSLIANEESTQLQAQMIHERLSRPETEIARLGKRMRRAGGVGPQHRAARRLHLEQMRTLDRR
jgi:hypothetical protein